MRVRPLWTDQYGERPENVHIDTLVIHSMHHPEDQDLYSAAKCKQWLDSCHVSCHYLIDREGLIWQSVLEKYMAWHAGTSRMPFDEDQRERVNEFSIGVELIASEDSGIELVQYAALEWLVRDIATRHPLKTIVGHHHIAPDRKSDPWGFDWKYCQQLLPDIIAPIS